MNPSDIWFALRDRWWILVGAALLAALAAFVYTRLPWTEPRWRSSVQVQAAGRLDYGNSLAIDRALRPLAEQVRQLSVMREVDQKLHTDLGPEKILAETKANPVQDTSSIQIDVEDADPARAERLALEISTVYTQLHNALQEGLLREERVILTPLDRDTRAILIWPQTRILVPAAGLIGLLIASAVVIGAAYRDESLRTMEDVRTVLALPVLASIPFRSASRDGRQRRNTSPPAIAADRPAAGELIAPASAGRR